MSNPAMQSDSLPWYRQFWPWFLIALPASVVVAGFSTLYIANRHADDLVVDDYYKNGLAINRALEGKNRAAAMGISADIELTGHSANARLSGEVNAGALQLLLSHPLEADHDYTLTLRRVAPGVYTAPLSLTTQANWHWVLSGPDENPWRLDGTVAGAIQDRAGTADH